MAKARLPHTEGSTSPFDPSRLHDPETVAAIHEHLSKDDLRAAIIQAFQLPAGDAFVYHANASVNLAQVQSAVNAGSANGLHDWYLEAAANADVDPVQNLEAAIKANHPNNADIAAFLSIFDPSKSSANTLKGILANSKKGSLRARISDYLISRRLVDSTLVVPKSKKGHSNPYADFWAWSCKALEWAGPEADTVNIKLSHHVLPVFMHHFGCVCPSYESLKVLELVSKDKVILDVGSGNGYWTHMLRRHGCNVVAIDNGQSKWRTCWIGDTVEMDAVKYIKAAEKNASQQVLLMVYPVVGLDFTNKVLNAYKGDVVAVAGTQNGNGYTGFKNEDISQWMGRERPDFERIVQIPLMSFAGKDDALFVFKRRS